MIIRLYYVRKQPLFNKRGKRETIVCLACGRKSGCHLYFIPAQLMGNVIIPVLYYCTKVLFAFLSH